VDQDLRYGLVVGLKENQLHFGKACEIRNVIRGIGIHGGFLLALFL
jgi:hypothetical protein